MTADLQRELAQIAQALRGRLQVETGFGIEEALAPGGLPPERRPRATASATAQPPGAAPGAARPPADGPFRRGGGGPASPASPAAAGRTQAPAQAPPPRRALPPAHAAAPARPPAPRTPPAARTPPAPAPSAAPASGAAPAIDLDAPIPAAVEERVAELRALEAQLQTCRLCKLADRRTTVVVARGDPQARLMFVGEGPGAEEDRQGLPFVGPAGQLLDKIIAAMGLDPASVYIANVVKCRPPGNREPTFEETQACSPFLRRQIALVGPEVIVALGGTAARLLLKDAGGIGRLRGRWHEYAGVPLLATYHPAYLLRQPGEKRKVWDDMKIVMRRLGLAVPGEA